MTLYYNKLEFGGWGLLAVEDNDLTNTTLIIAKKIDDLSVHFNYSLNEEEFKTYEEAPMKVVIFYRELLKTDYYKELVGREA